MEIIIVESLTEAGEIEAKRLADTIEEHPETVLGLATGSSPLPLYQAAIRASRSGHAQSERLRPGRIYWNRGIG
jgi:glucosamine-6-phosphate deaminase